MNEPTKNAAVERSPIEALTFEVQQYDSALDRLKILVSELAGDAEAEEKSLGALPAPGCFRVALVQGPDRLRTCNEALNTLVDRIRELCLQ